MTGRRLRFCMVTTFYPPYSFGGDAILVQQLGQALARRGHHVEVVHCIDAYRLLGGQEPTSRPPRSGNVIVHGLRSRFGFLSPLATQQLGVPFFKARRLRRILERDFDVIHFHNISLVGGPGVLSYGRGIKLYTLHEYWLVCPTHVLYKFNREPCERRQCLSCTLSHGRPPQWWRRTGLLPRALRHVDALLAPSPFVADRHRPLQAPTVLMPNFTPAPPAEAAAEPGVPEPYFLFVGRLEKIKGLQTVLHLFQGDGLAHLIVAGTGSHETPLRRQASGHSRIHFLGRVEGPRLRALYRGARALIVPSLCYEVFPLVIVESFQQRTPVLARRIGGMTDLIQQSGGGFAYEHEAGLEAAMQRLLADPLLRDELGERGHQAYQRHWTEQAHLERYLGLIAELGERKRTRTLMRRAG